jgi:hypothetical protein
MDDAVTRALAAAAPYGAVPPAILQGRAAVTVCAPYDFHNPMIR